MEVWDTVYSILYHEYNFSENYTTLLLFLKQKGDVLPTWPGGKLFSFLVYPKTYQTALISLTRQVNFPRRARPSKINLSAWWQSWKELGAALTSLKVSYYDSIIL